ncbi:MAG: hypothetical protein HOW73_32280 [Polyangiaceae bacterium]|nr:hypothetical protein [Polyangiaceae bacterium]
MTEVDITRTGEYVSGSIVLDAALNPLGCVQDLARLCARLAIAAAPRDSILADAGVDVTILEEARARWSHPILSDRATAQQFQVSYAEECRSLKSQPTRD